MKRLTLYSQAIESAGRAIADAFATDALLTREQAVEVAASTLGFRSYEFLRQYNAPTVLAPGREYDERLPPNLHLARTTERIRDLIGCGEFQAMGLASAALKAVRSLGLQVDATLVALAPAYESVRSEIFLSMSDHPFPPTQASVAVGLNLLPPLPPTPLGCLQLLKGGVGFLEKVATRPTYLWDEADRSMEPCASAYTDRVQVRNGVIETGELGLRSCVIEPFEPLGRVQGRDYIMTPVIAFAYREWPWRTDLVAHQPLHEPQRLKRSLPPIEDVIGGPVESLLRLRVCRHCLALYSDKRDDLRHECDQSSISAHAVFTGLTVFRGSNRAFGIDELAAAMKASDVPGTWRKSWSGDALGQFFSTNLAAFRARSMEDGWITTGDSLLERFVSR